MTNDITLNERFSDFELAQMFNVEFEVKDGRTTFGTRTEKLWKNAKRSMPRREQAAGRELDTVSEKVTCHAPGTRGRMDDLARYYSNAESTSDETSPFAC